MLYYILGAKSFDTLEEWRKRLVDSTLKLGVSRMATLDKADLAIDWEGDKVEFYLAQQALRWNPEQVRGFTVWFGQGCEAMVIGLAKTDHGLIFEAGLSTIGDLTPSLELFEHRHVTACDVLDIGLGVGMEVDATDTSGYWKSRRLEDLRTAGKDALKVLGTFDQAIQTPFVKIARSICGYQNEVRPS